MSRSKALIFAGLLAAVLVWGPSFAATRIALREVSPVTVIWLRFAMGVAAVATGMLLVGEHVDWATVVGGIVMLVGVWLVNRRNVPGLSEDPALAVDGNRR